MEQHITDGYPLVTSTGKLNFIGMFQKYFSNDKQDMDVKTIDNNWYSPETFKTYLGIYKAVIFPEIPLNLPASEYTEEDLLAIIDRIKKKNRDYTEQSIERCTLLLWRVYEVGFLNNEYEDKIFWNKSGLLTQDNKKRGEVVRRMQLTRKSFSIAEEKKLLSWFNDLDPESCKGTDIGIALMFFLGLRNNEACGLDFNDVRLLHREKEIPLIYVTKTSKINSTERKAGGKTTNAIRGIPCFDFLFEFLMKRKQKIENMLKESASDKSEIESLPLVCSKDFFTLSTTTYLTNAAKDLFRELGIINSQTMEALEDTLLFQCRMNGIDIGEKEATAYLFRRNAATNMYNIGLTAGEIQYLMGHDVEEDGEERNYFTNADRLERIYNVLCGHPYHAFFNRLFENQRIVCEKDVYAVIQAEEPAERIIIKNNSNSRMKIRYCAIRERDMEKKDIDIRCQLRKLYYI